MASSTVAERVARHRARSAHTVLLEACERTLSNAATSILEAGNKLPEGPSDEHIAAVSRIDAALRVIRKVN